METIAAYIGYFIILIIIIILLGMLYKFIVYGSIGNHTSITSNNNCVIVNGKIVYEGIVKSVSDINGTVYVNGEKVYSPKKRWEKS